MQFAWNEGEVRQMIKGQVYGKVREKVEVAWNVHKHLKY